MGITVTVVNVPTCQSNMKNDTHGKFTSSSPSFIMNGGDFFHDPTQFQVSMECHLKVHPMLT